tara:strand:+ start:531 stop:728 length:198 start_codon:yes stop_codon:yes gene_type:complete
MQSDWLYQPFGPWQSVDDGPFTAQSGQGQLPWYKSEVQQWQLSSHASVAKPLLHRQLVPGNDAGI